MKYIDFLLRVFAGCFLSVGVFNAFSPNGKDPVIYFLLGLVFLLLLSGKKKEASKEAGDALMICRRTLVTLVVSKAAFSF